MKPEIAKRWVDALRSGEYKQGRAALRRNDAFCCLGVLCDLYSKETGAAWSEEPCGGLMSIHGDSGALPDEVLEWAGYRSINPDLRQEKGGTARATDLNDSLGADFHEIADAVERTFLQGE